MEIIHHHGWIPVGLLMRRGQVFGKRPAMSLT